MNVEQHIRRAVHGLTGQAREDAILDLRTHPEKLKPTIRRVMRAIRPNARTRPLAAPVRVSSPRYIRWWVRLTPEEYVALKTTARNQKRSMASLVRARMFNEQGVGK